MKEYTKNVLIEGSSEQTLEVVLRLLSFEDRTKIILVSDQLNEYKITEDDFFECQMSLRLILEGYGYRLLIQGARANVYPSGMSRQMSKGMKAYIHQLGKNTTRRDLINTFDFAESSLISSVAKQKEFHTTWLKSL